MTHVCCKLCMAFLVVPVVTERDRRPRSGLGRMEEWEGKLHEVKGNCTAHWNWTWGFGAPVVQTETILKDSTDNQNYKLTDSEWKCPRPFMSSGMDWICVG